MIYVVFAILAYSICIIVYSAGNATTNTITTTRITLTGLVGSDSATHMMNVKSPTTVPIKAAMAKTKRAAVRAFKQNKRKNIVSIPSSLLSGVIFRLDDTLVATFFWLDISFLKLIDNNVLCVDMQHTTSVITSHFTKKVNVTLAKMSKNPTKTLLQFKHSRVTINLRSN